MRTYSHANTIFAFQESFVRGRILLVGHEFSEGSDVNTGSCVPIPNAIYTFIILFFYNNRISAVELYVCVTHGSNIQNEQ